MRIIVAALAAFLVAFVLGGLLIPVLRALKAGQSIKEIGPKWHKAKEGTPTMGGLMFIVASVLVTLIAAVAFPGEGTFSAVVVICFACIFGAIGFADDFAKVKGHHNDGISAGLRVLLELAAAAAFLSLPLPWPVYLAFAAFIIVGCVNSVNITDGLDGLAGSVTLVVMIFYTTLCIWWEQPEVGMLAAALTGGIAAFLCYNFHPARVFMGDTGSLFLGGAVCGIAFALDAPMVLVLCGIIYIAETASDIIQVTYFKATHGKRIFRMAPLHHHLELGGWSEVRIVLTFAGITAAFCLLAFAGVMYRYPV